MNVIKKRTLCFIVLAYMSCQMLAYDTPYDTNIQDQLFVIDTYASMNTAEGYAALKSMLLDETSPTAVREYALQKILQVMPDIEYYIAFQGQWPTVQQLSDHLASSVDADLKRWVKSTSVCFSIGTKKITQSEFDDFEGEALSQMTLGSIRDAVNVRISEPDDFFGTFKKCGKHYYLILSGGDDEPDIMLTSDVFYKSAKGQL